VRLTLGAIHQRDEARRIQQFSGGIEQNFLRVGMFRPRIETPRLDLAHFAFRETRGAFDVLLGHGVGVRVARLADIVEK